MPGGAALNVIEQFLPRTVKADIVPAPKWPRAMVEAIPILQNSSALSARRIFLLRLSDSDSVCCSEIRDLFRLAGELDELTENETVSSPIKESST